jgi:hypothetical protein
MRLFFFFSFVRPAGSANWLFSGQCHSSSSSRPAACPMRGPPANITGPRRRCQAAATDLLANTPKVDESAIIIMRPWVLPADPAMVVHASLPPPVCIVVVSFFRFFFSFVHSSVIDQCHSILFSRPGLKKYSTMDFGSTKECPNAKTQQPVGPF